MSSYEFNEPADPSDDDARGPDGMCLGPYDSYAEYLQSDEWRYLREQAIARDGGRCIDCGGYAEEVHHRFYPDHIDETELDQLVSLCRVCHSQRPKTGSPMSPEERYKRLRKMLLGRSSYQDD